MAPQRPGPRQGRTGGVALGVLGIMVLAFFTIVLLLGRPAYNRVYEEIVHPFDSAAAKGRGSGTDAKGAAKVEVLPTDDLATRLAKAEAAAAAATKAAQAAKADYDKAVAGQKKVPVKLINIKKTEVRKAEEKATAAEAEVDHAATAHKLDKLTTDVAKAKAKDIVEASSDVPKRVAGSGGKAAAVAEGEGLSALDEKYTPTKEMVAKIAQDGYLVVTWANFHYWDFVQTWVAHIKEVGVTGYIIGAMDDKLLQELVKDELNCFSMRSGLTHGDFGWGSKTFAKMGREKIRLVALFLKLDVHVIISDVDVSWLRNPIPYFQKFPTADILTSSDHLSNTVSDESLERWPMAASAANIGIMLFREKSLPFVEKWIDLIAKDEKIWDQNAFNDMFRRGVKELPDDPQHLFMAYDGTLKMGILPVSIFCSGHTYFVQRMAEGLGLQPYAVHATFQFSGTPGKRNRLREMQIWEDPPEYYNHPVGFLSFTLDGMDDLIKNAAPSTGQMDLANVQGHFKLANYQLLRVRHALAIAGLMGRALVMPQLWAGQDRWWAPHSGRIPGSHTHLPMRVPMDHYFDLEQGWSRQFPEDEYGPNVPYKESSFLNNSKLPAEVRDSKVTVEICAAGASGCSDGTTPAVVEETQGMARVRVQAGLKSDALKVALEKAAQYKVVHFTTMTEAFGGYSDPKDWEKLQRRVRLYVSIWCCILAHPGHVHYDMLWDVPGHTDKFNKKWPGIWEVTTGP